MVGEQKRDGFVALLEFPEDVERSGAGIGAQNAIVLGVLGAKVAFNGAENVGIVVDSQNDGFRHFN
jgi:hypothetical protein